MRQTSIRTRVLLLAIVPPMIISLVLSVYMARARIHDMDDELRARGDAVTRHVALQSEFGLFSEDVKSLNEVASTALREADVQGVTIMDTHHRVLAAAHRPQRRVFGLYGGSEQSLMIFTLPVVKSGVALADFNDQYHVNDNGAAGAQPVGWVELQLSKSDTLVRQQVVIDNALLMAAAATLFSALLALFIGRGIIRPLQTLNRAVDSLRKGEFHTRISAMSGGEIGALETGFNEMAAVLEKSQADLQNEIEIATRKLSVLLESLPVAVYRLSVDTGYLVFITPNVKALTGFEAELFTGPDSIWKERIHPEDARKVLERLSPTAGAGNCEFEYRWRVADGSYKWFYDYLRVLSDENGNCIEVIGMWQDISEFRRISQQLHSTIDVLEHKNRELDMARQRALAASEEKAKFLANMSHEIRTPLNAIIGYSSLLGKAGLSAEQNEHLGTINRASNQLLRVIDDILNFSKLESGTVQLDHAPFNLRDAFEDVVAMLAPEAQDKNLELVLLFDSDVPVRLIGDSSRINQVLINLISNAIKFTERGNVNVQVIAVNNTDERAEIEVRVTDTGIGMTEDVQRKIFSSFHQADASISRRYGGAGLGLAIVARLVELWGGRVGVTSAPDKGSTFWFTFQCLKQALQDDSFPNESLPGTKVLLYDDNPIASRAVRNLLLTWSMDVFQAKSTDRILSMLSTAAAAPFDLVILGTSVAAGDGTLPFYETVDEIRSRYPVPVLLLFNCERTAWLHRPLHDSGIAVMFKPVRRDNLYREICDLLNFHCDKHWPPTAVPAPSAEFAGLRVLVAEDNEFNRALVTAILGSRGVEVTAAGSGDQAVILAGEREFDVVIVDIHLPGMDGTEAARRIRARCPHVPIIALTADVFFDDPDKLAQVGIDSCLLKPLDENRLWHTLRELCRGDRRGREPGAGEDAPAPPPSSTAAAPIMPILRQDFRARLLAELPRHRDLLERALAADDRDGLRKHVHELKGVAGYFGFSQLVERVSGLEEALRRGAPADRVAACLSALSEQIDALLAECGSTV